MTSSGCDLFKIINRRYIHTDFATKEEKDKHIANMTMTRAF